jgi:serine/threonine protein kinase
MDRQSMVFSLNTVLADKYRLVREIGQGGMGVVYEAEHITIGRRFAIKCLHRRYIDDSRAIGRFQQEAKLAGTVGHDNICEVIDVGFADDGVPYLVMPLLVGASLHTIFQTEIVSVERLVDIARQALSALNAAFQAGIVHRDLKPDNIFITKVGDRADFVKLLDFGISKVLDPKILMHLTRTGDIVGTPEYMSPEQAAGSEEIDQRADLWALGVILYEGLTGRCPFDGTSYNEVIIQIVNNAFPVPRALNPSVPRAVERVVLKALSRDPEARYRTPMEMDAALVSAMQELTPVGISAPCLSVETRSGDSRMFAPSRRMSTPDSKPIALTPIPLTSRQSSPDKKSATHRKRFIAAAAGLGILSAALSYVLWSHHTESPEAIAIPQTQSTREKTTVRQIQPPTGTKPLQNIGINAQLEPNTKAATVPLGPLTKSRPDGKTTVSKKRSASKPSIDETPYDGQKAPTTPDLDTEKENLIKRGIKFEASYE